MSLISNRRISVKLVGSFIIVAVLLAAVTAVSSFNMQSLNAELTEMYNDRTLPIAYLGQVGTSLYRLRGDLHQYLTIPIPAENTDEFISEEGTGCVACHPAAVVTQQLDGTEQSITADIATINDSIVALRATRLTQAQHDELKVFDKAWVNYQQQVAAILK